MNPFARMPQRHQAASSRGYQGADNSRYTTDWNASGTSQDSETLLALRPLRQRSRQLIRDYHMAKACVRVLVNNIVGMGVGMQPESKLRRGDKPDEKTNAAIKKAWKKWCKKNTCDVAGKLSFSDIERQIIKSLASDGEAIIRKHRTPYGGGKIPLALEVIESDLLIDYRNARAVNGNEIRMGVEMDPKGRPVAYWFYPQHPGDYQFQGFSPSSFVRVPADEIIHIFVSDRPKSTRGIPWMHAAMTKMRHASGYEEAEVIAARASACIMAYIETPDGDFEDDNADDKAAGERNLDMEPGTNKVLAAGEKLSAFLPQRPGNQYEPFMRTSGRQVAAANGVGYESLTKDYSQSNYSSSRLSLLDERDYYRILQWWLIENFHENVFGEWLGATVLCGELSIPFYYSDMDNYNEVTWKPRGWAWVDPFKEVQAYRAAVRSGFKTQTAVLAEQGDDIEEVIAERKREVQMAKDAELVFDTDAGQVTDKGVVQLTPPPDELAAGAAGDSTQQAATGNSEQQQQSGLTAKKK